jgi:hypothetical protein
MFDWAEPVQSKGWAVVAVVFDRLKRMSGYHLFINPAHVAWERAIGLRPRKMSDWWRD